MSRKTKIIATLGPASSTAAQIEALARAGADVFRLNFSHGTHEDHQARASAIRQVETKLGRPLGILLDLQGPKLRIGQIAAGKATLIEGKEFRLDNNPTPGDASRAYLPHPEIFAALVPGHHLLIDDGKIKLRVVHVTAGEARTQVKLDMLLKIMETDRVSVGEGDILCLHTGLGQLIVDSPAQGPDRSIRLACAVLDGADQPLLNWISETGIAAIAADNLAVESSSTLGVRKNIGPQGAILPLHEHCLFKIGVHLGELWYLTELANWLHANQRNRFLLTAPPLRLPGAVGSPVTPVATV